jgi:hypothetical protein
MDSAMSNRVSREEVEQIIYEMEQYMIMTNGDAMDLARSYLAVLDEHERYKKALERIVSGNFGIAIARGALGVSEEEVMNGV